MSSIKKRQGNISRFELIGLLILCLTKFTIGSTDFASTEVQRSMETQNHPADTRMIRGSTSKCAHGI